MKKEQVVEILLALEKKYYHLMEVAEAAKDSLARSQYFAIVAAYSNAVKIVASEEYAEQVRKELEQYEI